MYGEGGSCYARREQEQGRCRQDAGRVQGRCRHERGKELGRGAGEKGRQHCLLRSKPVKPCVAGATTCYSLLRQGLVGVQMSGVMILYF